VPARKQPGSDADKPAAPSLSLTVQHGEGFPGCQVSRARLRRWIAAALQRDARITLRFVGTREGRALNLAYRQKDYATNVLTFNYDDADSTTNIADIVICVPVVRREAARQRKPFDHHLAHLVIHGTLHAQGLEHDDEVEAQAMEALEAALLKRFRIGDPYLPNAARRRKG
jgi:probable rRNA maturation factor